MIIIYVIIGGRLLFKNNSPLNGKESIIIAVLIFISAFTAVIAGFEADQSHHYLEYQTIVNERAARNFNSPNLYDYYPMPNVAGKTFTAFLLMAGSFFYASKREKERLKLSEAHVKSAEHQSWSNSLNSIKSKRHSHS